MSNYLLGIDAGGTKTHASLADETGRIIAIAQSGGANWERYGIKGAQETLSQIISQLLRQTGISANQVGAATLALAGIDWPADLSLFEEYVSTLGFAGPTAIINDAFGSLYAGAPEGIGCVSIAGTGGKTAGSDGSQSIQTMGMELGEGGGSGQLISLALEKIAREFHAGKDLSPLAELLMKKSEHSSLSNFFYSISRENLRLFENLAPAIFELAAGGDLDAADIITKVAHQHALDVMVLCQRLNFTEPIKIIRSGGLHTAGSANFDEAFERTLKTAEFEYQLSVLEISPSYGSIIHASHNYFGGVNSQFIETLITQARERAQI